VRYIYTVKLIVAPSEKKLLYRFNFCYEYYFRIAKISLEEEKLKQIQIYQNYQKLSKKMVRGTIEKGILKVKKSVSKIQ